MSSIRESSFHRRLLKAFTERGSGTPRKMVAYLPEPDQGRKQAIPLRPLFALHGIWGWTACLNHMVDKGDRLFMLCTG